MSTAKPLVSIFICTYNQEDFVEETLESFLNQKCNFDFEIVIAEDCSKDNTAAICEDYMRKYPDKIVLLKREKNLGLIKNFFEGYSHCRGKYVAMCGGDDYWTDDSKLQKQVNFLEANPDCVITYHDSELIDENGKLIADTEVGYNNRHDFSKEELQYGAFLSARTMCFRNVVDFSKTTYHKIFNEDIFIISILGEYGYGKYIEDVKPAIYRILQSGIWSSRNKIQRDRASMRTFAGLMQHYEIKKNRVMYDFFKAKYFAYNNRILFLSTNDRVTNEVYRSFFISLFNRNSKYNKIKVIILLKTLFKYLFHFSK